jgi:hypothetical protein
VVADGGGRVAAARHPVVGADKVAAFLSTFSDLAPGALVDTVWLNGTPGGRVIVDGELNTVMSFVVDGSRISRMYAVRNPHKLRRLDEEAELAR